MIDTEISMAAEQIGNVRIVCVGDVMLDRFVYGDVSRISPEAPVPVCRVLSERTMLGGAGNVVRNLDAVGVTSHLISVIGVDEPANELQELLGQLKSVTPHFVFVNTRQTTVKERFISRSQHLLRVDRESVKLVSKETSAKIIEHVTKIISGVDALIISDYGKGVLPEGTISAIISSAKKEDIPVIVDPKGKDYSRYRGATLITPNQRELAEASHMSLEGNGDIGEAAKKIAEENGIANVLVTRSSEGMTLVTKDKVEHLSAEAQEVFDVSGAGDTVVAIVSAAIAGKLPLITGARLANIAAGIVVGKMGTATIFGQDLTSAIRRHDYFLPTEAKVNELPTALAQISEWRGTGQKIGFTNGCFDLIHPGHITLLTKARKACDKLIVGLNTDQSVKLIKGQNRPIQDEMGRSTVLASLACVDLVILFSEETPQNLIEVIHPDVLVKGADYKLEDVVGADTVQSYGGNVLLVDIEVGHSTTGTIARIIK